MSTSSDTHHVPADPDGASATPRVDAHQHYWQVAAQEQAWRTPSHEAIARDYGPADLRPDLERAGIAATVLMQSVDTAAENDRMARYARDATVAGVVGWLPLQDPAAARAELERSMTPAWCGVRCLVGRESLAWLAHPDVVALFRDLAAQGLAWDVVPVTAEQVDGVLGLARAVPDLRIVIDHLCRPPVDTGGWEPWAGQLAELAASPGTALKVSVGIDVLTSWDEWRPQELQRYVSRALEQFGPDRLMLASNWPVVLLKAGHGRAWDDLTAAVRAAGARDAELAAVQGGTAVRWYGLDVAGPAAGADA